MMFAVQPEDPTPERLSSCKAITINIAYVQTQQLLFISCLLEQQSHQIFSI